MFSSLNMLEFERPSRRDDLISLCYLLSYLLNQGHLKDMDFDRGMDQMEVFEFIRKAKRGHTLGDMCYKNAQCLNAFVVKVFSLKFEDEPDYEDLYRELADAFSIKIVEESK